MTIHEKNVEKFKEFLVNGLKISDPNNVEYVDKHTFPQHLVKKNRRTIDKPIIVKIINNEW